MHINMIRHDHYKKNTKKSMTSISKKLPKSIYKYVVLTNKCTN